MTGLRHTPNMTFTCETLCCNGSESSADSQIFTFLEMPCRVAQEFAWKKNSQILRECKIWESGQSLCSQACCLLAARVNHTTHEENASGGVFANDEDEGVVGAKNRVHAD